MINVRFILFSLLILFVGCNGSDVNDDGGNGDTDLPVAEYITKVEIVGETPESVEINKEKKRINIKFGTGFYPSSVVVKLTLNEGVEMVDPKTTTNTFDLTKTVPIRIKANGTPLTYAIITDYDKNSLPTPVEGKFHDISLLSYGGSHRWIEWNYDQCMANVVYKDREGQKHWMFDTFLFIEGLTGKGRYFAPDGIPHEMNPNDGGARKTEWEALLDTTIGAGMPAHILDKAIGDAIVELGEPKYRRQVIMTLPIAASKQTNWGELRGRALDFNNNADRIEAAKWYIDLTISRFKDANFKNFEFAGFYWISESLADGTEIVQAITDYIHEKGYKAFWIPYNSAVGFPGWKEFSGFDMCFYQPNYFFPNKKPDYSMLTEACEAARRCDAFMEMEFDERAVKGMRDQYWPERYYDYVRAFEQYGAVENQPIAYYQGDCVVYDLFKSTDVDDQDLFHHLGSMISKRQQKLGEK